MRNVCTTLLIVIIALALTAFSASAFPSMSEMEKCSSKMNAFSQDLVNLSSFSQIMSDKKAVIELANIVSEYRNHAMYIKDLLFITEMVKNNPDRKIATDIIGEHAKYVSKMIDLSIKSVNLYISNTKNNDIESIGNQIIIELRKLKELLSN
jgi:hypothetical protein